MERRRYTFWMALVIVMAPSFLLAQDSTDSGDLWQRLISIAREPELIQSDILRYNEILGPLPSPEAQSHIAEFANTLVRTPSVPDAATKYFCLGLAQYGIQWSMPIAKEKLPLQYQADAPSEYVYKSPLASVIPQDHQEVCKVRYEDWLTSSANAREAMTLWYSFGRGCTRESCPTGDSKVRAQIMKYLLHYLDQKIWGSTETRTEDTTRVR